MSKGFLITISGIDGSGKSSNTVALQQSLEQMGLPVTRAWVGHKPIFSFPFLAVIRLLGYTRREKIHGIMFYWRDVKRNTALSKLWPFVLALDFVPKALISVTLPLWRGKVVVCDRYAYDLIAQMSQEAILGDRTKKILLNVVPRPSIAFLMDVNEKLAWDRVVIPGRAREQPYYDLLQRRKLFLELAREFGMIVLRGEDDPSWNGKEILRRTLDRLGDHGVPVEGSPV